MKQVLLLLTVSVLLQNCQKNDPLTLAPDASQTLPQLLNKKWVQTNVADYSSTKTFAPNDHFTPRYEFGQNNQVVYTYGVLSGDPVCGFGVTDCNGNPITEQPAAAKGTYSVESSGSHTVISLRFSESTFSKTWELVSLDDQTLTVQEK